MSALAKTISLFEMRWHLSYLGLVLCIFVPLMFSSGMSFAQNSAATSVTKLNAEKEPIQIKLDRKKVTNVGGNEILVVATEAKPGEVFEEKATYINQSKKNLRVDATLPVPQYTELIVSSVKPARAKASVDGTTFEAIPLKRNVKQANGVVLEQIVPVIEYRFLRWDGVDLGPEKTFIVSARFKLSENSGSSAGSQSGAPRK